MVASLRYSVLSCAQPMSNPVHTKEQLSLELNGCRMRLMRRRLLQGSQCASTRARRVVAARRSEQSAVVSIFNKMRGQHVAMQPRSACQESFSL
jgi:hypothetical protein